MKTKHKIITFLVLLGLDGSPPERITSITQLKVIPSDKAWITEHKDEIVTKFTYIFGRRKD